MVKISPRLKRVLNPWSAVGAMGIAASFAFLRPQPSELTVTPRPGDDTLVVNHHRQTQLRLSVLDQYGRPLRSDTVLQYQRIGGDSIQLSPSGRVLCAERSDAVVRATFEKLSREFVLRCRPVAWIEAPSWIDLVIGDSAHDLSFTARDPDGRVVTELRGVISVSNSSVAGVEGTRIRPRHYGATAANIDVGDAHAGVSLVVYQMVTAFVNRRDEPFQAMQVTLARGDTIEVPLPKAAFWISYFSRDRNVPPPTIVLRGDGSCTSGDGLHRVRLEEGVYTKYCLTGDGARMMVTHGNVGPEIVNGTVGIHLVW